MADRLWLPSFFKPGMILQQQVKTLLSGKARPKNDVSVTINRKPFDNRPFSPMDKSYGTIFSAGATCDEDGFFSVELPALKGSFDPLEMTICSGKDKKVLDDLLVGEVWVTAGQANMQMPLATTMEERTLVRLATHRGIRFLTQHPEGLANKRSIYHYGPHKDLAGANWVCGDQPNALKDISAIAFHFARELHAKLKVPVGVIETALRDTHIHAWLSRVSVDAEPKIRDHIVKIGCYRSAHDWNMNKDRTWSSQQPAALFNSKIAPFNGYGVRGIAWHNGESDYQYPDYYKIAFKNLIEDWHQVFRPADPKGLGLITVLPKPQLHGHHRFEQLAEFNEMLVDVNLSLKNPTGVIPIYDLPLDYKHSIAEWKSPLHPTGKQPVGERLKTVALGLMYHKKAPRSAPICSQIEKIGDKLILSFDNIGDGLRLIGEDSRVRGFTICGEDRIFVEAQAKLLYGLKVLVWHEQIKTPKAVTYAYADFNHHANLTSRDKLPVVPFRSDQQPSKYWPPMEWVHCEATRIWCWPRFAEPDMTGWHPAWRISSGSGAIELEKANKCEGDGSLHLTYQQADCNTFGLEPILDYDCMFPPLDLSMYSQLTVDIFNPDRHFKYFWLKLAVGKQGAGPGQPYQKQTLMPALRWQRMVFDLSTINEHDLASIRRIIFEIGDAKGKGSLYLDNVRLIKRTQQVE